MAKTLRYYLLPTMVFITGACILIVEVLATRILSPYYGNTIFTVSSVISVILAALSIGYYAGGKLADRHPSLQWFFGIIFFSGVVLLFFHGIGEILLPSLSLSFSITLGPLISSLVLFFLPALLLGTLSPYAVKLQSVQFPEHGIGSIAGTIFFCSTLGSIIGSLLAGFVLIPNFGISQVIIANGILLIILGLVALLKLRIEIKYLYRYFFPAILIFGVVPFIFHQAQGQTVYSEDGVYEKILIYDGMYAGRPTRFFQQDHSNSGAMFLDSNDPKDLVYDYTKYYKLYKSFIPDPKQILVIGGGAYSIPKALLQELPDANVDVSEIEPSLFDLAKKYFQVPDNSRLRNYTDDGRRFLKESTTTYDLIFSDVYYSFLSVPSHFTTREFFQVAKSKLNKEGVFIGNFIGDLSRQQPSLIMSEIKTFQTVFPNSYFFAVGSPKSMNTQNIIFVGYSSEKKMEGDLYRDKLIHVDRFEFSPYPILTDNFSPAEYLTAQVVRRTLDQKNLYFGNEALAIIDQELRYGPRYPTASGHKAVQDFLIAEMGQLIPEVQVQRFKHRELNGSEYELSNIIARFNPIQQRRILLGSHYDSFKLAFKDSKRKNDPVPGANNSASGVAVLVELARVLANLRAIPNLGVDIVFFDGEEGEENQGGDFTNWKPLGSTYFAEHLNDFYPNDKPISALVLDMVCDKDLQFPKEPASIQYAPDQVATFWSVGQKINPAVFLDQIGPAIRDDHTPLNEVGIPSFLVIDYDYPFYATTRDTIDKCSAESLETIAQTVLQYIYATH